MTIVMYTLLECCRHVSQTDPEPLSLQNLEYRDLPVAADGVSAWTEVALVTDGESFRVMHHAYLKVGPEDRLIMPMDYLPQFLALSLPQYAYRRICGESNGTVPEKCYVPSLVNADWKKGYQIIQIVFGQPAQLLETMGYRQLGWFDKENEALGVSRLEARAMYNCAFTGSWPCYEQALYLAQRLNWDKNWF